MDTRVKNQIDHLFRHEYGKITAVLTSSFGTQHLESVEDAVQEALLKAMQAWAYGETPNDPSAWIYKVARHKLIDTLRKRQKLNYEGPSEQVDLPFDTLTPGEIEDEQLKMIFACCNPKLHERDRLLLSLKLIGGFSISEIARALLLQDEAAKKSVMRAKKRFRETVSKIEIPVGAALVQSLSSVVKVIYLIFNEGYKASDGDQLIKQDLCGEALRLAVLLSRHPNCVNSRVHALLSLMCFKAARFDARINEKGALVILEEQDRSTWNQEYVRWGFYHFNQAILFKENHPLLMEAGIEYQYHIARSFEDTDWASILELYDHLLAYRATPFLKLNRLVVYAKVNGLETALEKVKELEPDLQKHHLYYAVLADFNTKLGNKAQASVHYKKALDLAQNKIEKDFLKSKIAML